MTFSAVTASWRGPGGPETVPSQTPATTSLRTGVRRSTRTKKGVQSSILAPSKEAVMKMIRKIKTALIHWKKVMRKFPPRPHSKRRRSELLSGTLATRFHGRNFGMNPFN